VAGYWKLEGQRTPTTLDGFGICCIGGIWTRIASTTAPLEELDQEIGSREKRLIVDSI
jgi:hypothetical protein